MFKSKIFPQSLFNRHYISKFATGPVRLPYVPPETNRRRKELQAELPDRIKEARKKEDPLILSGTSETVRKQHITSTMRKPNKNYEAQ